MINFAGFRSQSSASVNNAKPPVADAPQEEISVKMQVGAFIIIIVIIYDTLFFQ